MASAGTSPPGPSELHFDLSRPLRVGLPVRAFQGDLVVVSRRLDTSVDVDCPGNDRVFAWGDLAEIDRKEDPAEFGARFGVESRFVRIFGSGK